MLEVDAWVGTNGCVEGGAFGFGGEAGEECDG